MVTIPNSRSFRGIIVLVVPLIMIACGQLENLDFPNPANQNIAVDKIKLNLNQDGLYKISQQELLQSGLAIEQWSHENLTVVQAGEELPFLIENDQLIFYTESAGDRYIRSYPIIISTGKPGKEMIKRQVSDIQTPKLDTVIQTIRFEENNDYHAVARKEDADDVWFWQILRQQEAFTTEINIDEFLDQAATIRINTWGVTHHRDVQDDHDYEIVINDVSLDTIQWDGQEYHTSETEIPSGTLKAGNNTIVIDNQPEGASFLDIFNINWFELDISIEAKAKNGILSFISQEGVYEISGFMEKPIIVDATDKSSPKLLEGWKYEDQTISLPTERDQLITIAESFGFLSPETIEPITSIDLRAEDLQADMVIVTADPYIEALTPLVAARQEEDLNVKVVSVDQIFDEFGFGAPTPLAIQDFITYTHNNWQKPEPKYLLLVGDATTDYLGNANSIPEHTVPSLLVPVQFSGETVSDSRLADVNNDMIPDLAVGRWPVQTVREVESLVERTLSYEKGGAHARALFTADGSEPRFGGIAKHIAESSDLPTEQVKILEGPSSSEITDEINRGAWVATYIGHGSLNRWGKEDIFTLDAVEGFDTTTPPIILQMTCLTGLFAHPEEVSLSEAMLAHPDGPISIVAATSLTLSAHQEPFAIKLLEELQNTNIERIGDAFQQAKLSLDIENSNGLREISDTFTLLGDPSAKIVRP